MERQVVSYGCDLHPELKPEERPEAVDSVYLGFDDTGEVTELTDVCAEHKKALEGLFSTRNRSALAKAAASRRQSQGKAKTKRAKQKADKTCLECSPPKKGIANLGSHLFHSHKMSTEQYNKKHNIKAAEVKEPVSA